MTGYYAQQVRRDAIPGTNFGGRAQRPPWAPLLPALLRPLGYRSYHSGKWHIDGKILAGGFDRSYSLEDHNRFFTPQKHTRDDRAAASGRQGRRLLRHHGHCGPRDRVPARARGRARRRRRFFNTSRSLRPIFRCTRRRPTSIATVSAISWVGTRSGRLGEVGSRSWASPRTIHQRWNGRSVRRITFPRTWRNLAPARSTGRCRGTS